MNTTAQYGEKIDTYISICIYTHKMEYISDYDYAEVKTFTLEELQKYLKTCEENHVCYSQHIETLEGEQKDASLEILKEYEEWIRVYKNEITLRLCIKTPPLKPVCYGCEQGYLNQMGHYGGCLPDPMDSSVESLQANNSRSE